MSRVLTNATGLTSAAIEDSHWVSPVPIPGGCMEPNSIGTLRSQR